MHFLTFRNIKEYKTRKKISKFLRIITESEKNLKNCNIIFNNA